MTIPSHVTECPSPLLLEHLEVASRFQNFLWGNVQLTARVNILSNSLAITKIN